MAKLEFEADIDDTQFKETLALMSQEASDVMIQMVSTMELSLYISPRVFLCLIC